MCCLFAALVATGCSAERSVVQSPADAAEASGLEAAVASYLGPWIERGDFKGVVLIARGDEVLVHRSFGFGASGLPEPSTSAAFRIASLTKTLTAGAILIYRERGLLGLEDPLARFLPGFPSADEITIEHLLAHAGGVQNPDESLFWGPPITLTELTENIASKPLLFEPGSRHQYSNAGYNLLARVIEIVSGRSFEGALGDAILGPLGMTSTGNYFGPGPAVLVGGRSPGPGPSGTHPVTGQTFTAAIGSGSLASTAPDLHRWALAVARRELFSMDGLFWPFGWGKIEAAGRHGLEQTGLAAGYSSSLAVFADEEVVVVCLNSVEAADWTRWNQALSELAFGQAVDTPDLPKPAPPPADLDRFVGVYEGDTGAARIENAGGLFLYVGESSTGKYLTPSDEGDFFLRNDVGRVRFEPTKGGNASILLWDFGDSALEFKRVGE